MKLKHLITMLSMAAFGWFILKLPSLLSKDDNSLIVKANHNKSYDGITKRMIEAKDKNDLNTLIQIENELKSNVNHEAIHWRAYNLYQIALIYESKGKTENAKNTIHQAIDVIEDSPKKNSDDYALLSLIRAFSIQFDSFFDVASNASKAKKEAQKAIEIDASGFRGYLVAGINDFYTPEMFGGGKESEQFFTKAVELSKKPKANEFVSWGSDLAYFFMVEYYQKKGIKSKADVFLNEGLKRFPESKLFEKFIKS